MKTATVRQIRHDFGSVLKMIEEGEEVTITRRNKPVARLAPPPPVTPKLFKRPDFASRLALRFPQGILVGRPLAERISEERDRY
jgi:prevent-host-death family protein